ncbi:MAG TPA: hypothetical protein VLW25_02965 [Bryobacteraceae bacterium]|nr:hypothetical protein [Bryobacteraceae bacterium]
MPLIQVRDVPEHLYRLLTQQAERERRSLAQQVLAVLARGLEVELDAKARRHELMQAIRASHHRGVGKLSDPVKSIRQDRLR